MSKLNRLTGTPWHVDRYTREEGDSRRHRSRCIYYRKEDSYCRQELGRCRGAAHCDFYREAAKVDPKTQQIPDNQGPSRAEVIAEKAKEFAVGRNVEHKVFGVGRITSKQGNVIEICFSDGQTKRLMFEDCVKNRLLTII